MSKGKGKPLKLHLFLIPSIVVLIAFSLTIMIFNVAVKKYVGKITQREIDSEFAFFDLYYNSGENDSGYNNEYDTNVAAKYNPDLFITVHSIIMDEDKNVVISEESFAYTQEEWEQINMISGYFKNHKIDLKNNKSILLNAGKESYYLRYKTYHGISYEGFSIIKDNSELAQDYIVVVYANISYLLNFVRILYRILVGLMIVFGLISIFVIFRLNKKIDKSFNKLKQYIIAVGKRDSGKDLKEPELEYLEFRDVSNTVNEMSRMIDEAQESQKQFFQNASHELRTPLMSIQGYAEGIMAGVMKDNKKSAEIIIRESEKMSSLVDEILFLSRIDINSVNHEFEVLDIKELLYICSWSVKGAADKKRLKIEHGFEEERILVMGDEKQLEKAFVNILSNAVRYAAGVIKVLCKVKDNRVEINMIDDGEGISKEDLPHVFERFYKGENGHFGIGLSITQTIIEQHGGKVEVDSKENNTDFKVSLPLYKKND